MSKRTKPSAVPASKVTESNVAIQKAPGAFVQALFREIVAKNDFITHSHIDNYIIRPADVKNLTERLTQTFGQYPMEGMAVSYTIAHHKKEKITFNTLKDFIAFDGVKPDPVNMVLMQMNCLIQAPGSDHYSNYEVQVAIPSYLSKREGDEFVLQIEINGDLTSETAIRTKIAYSNYVIARSLVATLDEWVKSLETHRVLTLPSWAINYFWPAQRVLGSIGAASVTYSVAILIETLGKGYSVELKFALLLSACVVGYAIVRGVLEKACKAFAPSRSYPFVIFNRGDENNYKDFLRRRKRAERIGAAVFSSFILGTLATVSARYILKVMGFS